MFEDFEFLTDSEYRDRFLNAGDVSALGPNCATRKHFVADEIKEFHPDKRQIDFVISTDTVDRSQDSIAADGWVLKHYRKNPVVLFAHNNRQPPIGKASRTRLEDGKLKSRVTFMPADLYPFADMIYRMYQQGFMKAVSVTLLPIEVQREMEDEERASRYGLNFLKQELLEFSAVPVPANPDALVDAKAYGIDVRPMASWCEKALADGGSLALPRRVIQNMRDACGSEPTRATKDVAMSPYSVEQTIEQFFAAVSDIETVDIEKANDFAFSKEYADLAALVADYSDEVPENLVSAVKVAEKGAEVDETETACEDVEDNISSVSENVPEGADTTDTASKGSEAEGEVVETEGVEAENVSAAVEPEKVEKADSSNISDDEIFDTVTKLADSLLQIGDNRDFTCETTRKGVRSMKQALDAVNELRNVIMKKLKVPDEVPAPAKRPVADSVVEEKQATPTETDSEDEVAEVMEFVEKHLPDVVAAAVEAAFDQHTGRLD